MPAKKTKSSRKLRLIAPDFARLNYRSNNYLVGGWHRYPSFRITNNTYRNAIITLIFGPGILRILSPMRQVTKDEATVILYIFNKIRDKKIGNKKANDLQRLILITLDPFEAPEVNIPGKAFKPVSKWPGLP